MLDLGTVAKAVVWADIVVSVCPPAVARDVASRVTVLGFAGIYVDANAIAPSTARALALELEASGASFVDGGIIGPPPVAPGTTRLFLSGDEAATAEALFADGPLHPVVVPGGPGAASAVKASYAAWTKGSAALLLAALALARAEGVEASVVSEWERSQPDLPARSEVAARTDAPKAWRFVGEMEEQAAAFAGAGLPDGFARAGADIYRRLAAFKAADPAPSLHEVLATLVTGRRR
jgi:3-hydroxyisobutyrate dehydrogenase-like beta-hydroxyacid dehydrogenase